VVFDKKECAITSGDNKVDGELKKIQPLMLPDPESSEDSEEESIEDGVYDEENRGDHKPYKKEYLECGECIVGSNRNTFHIYVWGVYFCNMEHVFFFSKKEEQNMEKNIEMKMEVQEVASGVVRA